jgi:hypothetical protein
MYRFTRYSYLNLLIFWDLTRVSYDYLLLFAVYEMHGYVSFYDKKVSVFLLITWVQNLSQFPEFLTWELNSLVILLCFIIFKYSVNLLLSLMAWFTVHANLIVIALHHSLIMAAYSTFSCSCSIRATTNHEPEIICGSKLGCIMFLFARCILSIDFLRNQNNWVGVLVQKKKSRGASTAYLFSWSCQQFLSFLLQLLLYHFICLLLLLFEFFDYKA